MNNRRKLQFRAARAIYRKRIHGETSPNKLNEYTCELMMKCILIGIKNAKPGSYIRTLAEKHYMGV